MALSACGGGGGGVIDADPVYATGGPPAGVADFVGHAFPAHAAVIDIDLADGTHSTSRDTLSIEYISETEIVVSTPEGPVAMTLNGSIFEGQLGGTPYSLQFGAAAPEYLGTFTMIADTPGFPTFTRGVFGFETPEDTIEGGGGIVAYVGESHILMSRDGEAWQALEGGSMLTANLTDQHVSGIVFAGDDFSLGISGANPASIFSGNTFSGDLIVSAAPEGFGLDSGAVVDGRFYGTDANSIGGTFAGSGSDLSGAFNFSGLFFGD